jgi:hypothetical protein
MLSNLFFIDQNMDAFSHEESIEVFDGNLNGLNDDLIDEVEQSLDLNDETED